MEPEFICVSCGHTFDSEPPFHDKPEKCPRELCGSDEIQTMKDYDEALKESMRYDDD